MKRIFFVLLFLVLSSGFVVGDNLFLTVREAARVDNSSNVVSGVSVVVCSNKDLSEDCLNGTTDSGGLVSFDVPRKSVSSTQTIFYKASKYPYQDEFGELSMYVRGGQVQVNTFGNVNLPDFGSVTVPFSAGALQFISSLFGGDYNASREGDLTVKLGGSTPLDFPGINPFACSSVDCLFLDSLNETIFLSVTQPAFLSFSDVFPECGLHDSDLAGAVKCGCEVVLPNLHLAGIFNLIVASFSSTVKLPEYVSNRNLLDGLLFWLAGIATPLALILVISFLEIVKIYVFAALTFLGWNAVLDLLFHTKSVNAGNFPFFVGLMVLISFVVSFWFLSIDLGFWGGLIR